MSDKRAPGRLRRSALLVAVAVFIAAVGVGVMVVVTPNEESPRRSLTRLTEAVEGKDWNGVQRYIDVDAVASNYMATLLANAQGDAAAEASATLGREGVKDNDTGMGDSGADSGGTTMNPVFNELFKDSLRKGVESGSLRSDAGGIASVLLGKKPKDIDYESADVALVTVEVPAAAGATRVITLRMERVGGLWRITSVANLDDLLGPLS